jgi:hypothetical protein
MEDMRLQLQSELGILLKDEWVTIASDGWTSRAGDTYLGITYHYIDSNWVLRSLTVDVQKLEGSTTGEELTWKVPTAWSKRTVAGIVANVTDCKTFMYVVLISTLVVYIISVSKLSVFECGRRTKYGKDGPFDQGGDRCSSLRMLRPSP